MAGRTSEYLAERAEHEYRTYWHAVYMVQAAALVLDDLRRSHLRIKWTEYEVGVGDSESSELIPSSLSLVV